MPKPLLNELASKRINIDINDLPILRDSANNFKALETLFATLHGGCSFGALTLINLNESQDKRFYSALAVNNTYCCSLSKKKMQAIVENYEKRMIQDRRAFMQDISEFSDMSYTWLTKLIAPDCFELVSCIKSQVICYEFDEIDYIYFIKEGDFEVSKNIKMDSSILEESANQIMQLKKENPEPGRITTQIKMQG